MKNSEYEITILLKSCKITGTYKGFYYLRDAVSIVLEDEFSLCNARKRIYGPIAEKYGVSPESVIRAIGTVCGSLDMEFLKAKHGIFPKFSCMLRPAPKELIEIFADYLSCNTELSQNSRK